MVDAKDFFISYNKADRSWAEWIAWVLEAEGYTTVVQEWDFKPGGNFVVEMDNATKQCERTLAVLSQDYLDAEFTVPEWAAKFARDPKGLGRNLVPVRVAPCDIEGCWAKSSIVISLVLMRRPHESAYSPKSVLAARNPLLLRHFPEVRRNQLSLSRNSRGRLPRNRYGRRSGLRSLWSGVPIALGRSTRARRSNCTASQAMRRA